MKTSWLKYTISNLATGIRRHFAATSFFCVTAGAYILSVILWYFQYGHSEYLFVSELNNANITVQESFSTTAFEWLSLA